MKQKKLESIIETVINTTTGMVIAYCTFHFILAPMLGIPITHSQNLVVTTSLTVVSVLRGYFWRRFFANGLHKKVHAFLLKTRKTNLVEIEVTDEEFEEILDMLDKAGK